MQKAQKHISTFLLICILFTSKGIIAQKESSKQQYLDSLKNLLTPSEIDSLEKEMGWLFDENKLNKNTFDLSINASNGQVSKNTPLTNKSTIENGLILNPLISFTLKNGIGLSYENIIINESNQTTLLQHTATIYYDYRKESKFAFNLFANKNFVKDSLLYDATLYDYGFGATFKYLKPYIQPYIFINYNTGTFNERFLRRIYQSSIKDFSTILGIQHSYDFAKIFNQKWDINFTPKLMLSMAAQQYKTTIPIPKKKLLQQAGAKRNLIPRNITNKFQPQSIGAELEATLSKGIFYFMPNIYVDYSLNSNGSNKKTYVITSATIGINF